MNFDLIEYKNSNNSFGMPETMLCRVDTLVEFLKASFIINNENLGIFLFTFTENE